MPGLEKSAPKVARPVTLSSPSGRLVRFPIHLLFEPFAVIAALSSIRWLQFRRFYSVSSAFVPPQPFGARAQHLPLCANRPHPGTRENLSTILQGIARWTTALVPCPVCRGGAQG